MLEFLLMAIFALIFLSLSFFVNREKRRLENLLDALRNHALLSTSSFSLAWAAGLRRKTIRATPMLHFLVAFAALWTGVAAFFFFLVAPKISIILVVGMAFLLNEEVLETLEYTKAVSNASPESMNENDVKSIRLAISTLKSGVKRYEFYALIFVVTGVFILEIFDAVIYGLAFFVGYFVPVSQQINFNLSIYLILFFFVLAFVFGGLILRLIRRALRRVYA